MSVNTAGGLIVEVSLPRFSHPPVGETPGENHVSFHASEVSLHFLH